jgi:hypothetical protein
MSDLESMIMSEWFFVGELIDTVIYLSQLEHYNKI